MITHTLGRLLGRLPIGWLQLAHSRPRLIAALAGVAFADILVLVQLGILGALNGTVAMTYAPIHADLVISSNDARMLTDGSPIARRFLAKVQADPGVDDAAALYLASADWTRADGSTAKLTVYGLPADNAFFLGPQIQAQSATLRIRDVALIDRLTRGVDSASLAGVSPAAPLSVELNGRAINLIGTFSLGGGFSADGALLVSDQTFLRLFPQRSGGTPSHMLMRLSDGSGPEVVQRLREMLAGEPLLVRTLQDASTRNWRTRPPSARPVSSSASGSSSACWWDWSSSIRSCPPMSPTTCGNTPPSRRWAIRTASFSASFSKRR